MAKQKQNPSDKGNIKKPRGGEERRGQAAGARQPSLGNPRQADTHTHKKKQNATQHRKKKQRRVVVAVAR
jgi:hypothetical protein